MKNQLLVDKTFLKMSRDLSIMSHCAKIKVGALAVLNGRIIDSGINGTPSGHPNCDDVHGENFDHVAHRIWADANEIHAEMNLISYAAAHGRSLAGATIYCTLQPCQQCMKNLTAAGVVRIVYDQAYDRMTEADRVEAGKFLKKSKIKYENIPLTDN